jgi:hypothetical protein
MSLAQLLLTIAIVAGFVTVLFDVKKVQAKTPVSIELIFAVDTSISVDGYEYSIMMKGIANAFRRSEIIDLIGHQNGVAVALFQWSSDINEQNMIGWHLLKKPASILTFAGKVEAVERAPKTGFTALGEAIAFDVRMISENAFEGRHLKIDVAGDGHNNFGIPVSISREKANKLEIVINGLPILTTTDREADNLVNYYRDKVILGPGAFVETASEYDDFARAFLRKLTRELSPLVSNEGTVPRGVSQETYSSIQIKKQQATE